MTVVKLHLRHDIRDWIDAKVEKGEYASAEDYLSELVERDRESRSEEERIEEIRQMIAEAEQGGTSPRRATDRVAEGERRLRARGIVSG